MATPTYTFISSITLGSNQSSVTFSNIPQDYRDLVLVVKALATPTNCGIQASINSNSENKYSVLAAAGLPNGSALSATETFTAGQFTYWGAIHTSTKGVVTVQFFDYSVTDKHKSWLTRSSNVSTAAEMTAGRWADTASITSLSLIASGSDSFATDSIFELYGIEA